MRAVSQGIGDIYKIHHLGTTNTMVPFFSPDLQHIARRDSDVISSPVGQLAVPPALMPEEADTLVALSLFSCAFGLLGVHE
jgi:hypothetical protein